MEKRKLYTTVEKEFLKEVVARNRNVIENKKTDGATLTEKNACWERITREFNDVPEHTERTTAQLKKLWDNIKTERKKELATHKRKVMMTGGGPPPKKLLDDPTDFMLNTFATEIESSIDNDTVALSQAGAGEYFIDDNGQFIPVLQEDGGTMEESDQGGQLEQVAHATPRQPDMSTEVQQGTSSLSSGDQGGQLDAFVIATPQQPGRSKQTQKGTSGREGVTTEARERVKRVKAQIAHDQQFHALVIEEQKWLVTLAKLKVETQQKVLALAALKLRAEEEKLPSVDHRSEE